MVATSWVTAVAASIGEEPTSRAKPSRERPCCYLEAAIPSVAIEPVDPPREELCQLKALYPCLIWL